MSFAGYNNASKCAFINRLHGDSEIKAGLTVGVVKYLYKGLKVQFNSKDFYIFFQMPFYFWQMHFLLLSCHFIRCVLI